MSLTAVAAAATAAAGTVLYVDGKYHLRHDLKTLNAIRRALNAPKFLADSQAKDELLVYHAIQRHAAADLPDHLFLEFEGRSWTYRTFYNDLQRVGNWLLSLGIQKGEIVAIDGPNSAEYLLVWFALEGIGAPPAFINNNLTGASLEHCVQLCQSKHLIAARDVWDAVEPSRERFEKNGTRLSYYDQAFFDSLLDDTPLPRDRTRGVKITDVASLIFTSGTTGLPKGTIQPVGRALITARGVAQYLNLKPSDKFYTCLPLYHGSANSLCTTPVIWAGASLCLGRRFSHKTFWPEVSASGANFLQYVGELCRYLVNAPYHPLERKHKIHTAFGNGLRPDSWEQFRERFGIPVILELYAATDGLVSAFNANKGPFSRGAIAVRGFLIRKLLGRAQIRAKIDPDTEDIIRGPDGFVIKCKTGEPGEVLQKVEQAMKESSFRGYYNNRTSTEKRWMQNVLAPGDLWFRTGDVMREDEDGRLYFVDRLGDTYRWKSENVSTNEVADCLGTSPQVAECSVYGVSVPNTDGRCGCAAIVLRDGVTPKTVDLAALAQLAISHLPRYAVPIFLRITPALPYTSTFKIQKGQAKREGIDLDLIEQSGSKDAVFWLPPGSSAYQPFTKADLRALQSGTVKL